MKKVILIILMAIISSFSYYGAVNEKGEKVVEFANSSQQENSVENEIEEKTQENIIERVGNTVAQAETIQDEETKVQETTKELTIPIAKKANKSEITNKNKKAKQEIKQKQDLKVKEQKDTKVINGNTTEKKEEINTNANQNKNTNKTNNAPKCTHSNGNWYNSKVEAEAVYNAEIKKWGDKWTSNEINIEEYSKKCPDGYEVWSCSYCNKWTIEMYY